MGESFFSISIIMNKKRQKDFIVVIIACLLSLRDYIYAFNEAISPFISLFIYGLLFFYFFLDILLFSKFNVPKKLSIILLFILIVTIIHFTSYPILTICLCVYLLRTLSMKKVICIFFYPRLVMTFIIMILYHLGLLNDVATSISYKLGGGTFHTMGISANPNTTACYFFSIIVLTYIYSRFSRKRWLYLLPLFFCIYITMITLSRTVLISTIVLYICDIIFCIWRNKFIKRCVLILPYLYIIFTFLFATYFSKNITLNKLFSFRPMFWSNYISQLQIKEVLWGSFDSKGVTVDSGFLMLFINGGLFLYIPFLLLLKKTLKWEKNIEPYYFVFIVVCFTFSFMESVLMTQLRDLTILLYLLLYKLFNLNYCKELVK